MTLLDLVTYLRRNILHDTGGTGTDWSAWSEDDYDSIQLRWTNEELTAHQRFTGRTQTNHFMKNRIALLAPHKKSDGLTPTPKHLKKRSLTLFTAPTASKSQPSASSTPWAHAKQVNMEWSFPAS